jgi:hypothetical protein
VLNHRDDVGARNFRNCDTAIGRVRGI